MDKKVDYSKLSDAELAAEANKNNLEAIAEIQHRYGERVFRHVLKSVLSVSYARDIGQRTFEAAQDNFEKGKYREEDKLLNWLYGIAHNLHAHDIDDAIKHPKLVITGETEIANPEESGEEKKENTEEKRRLMKRVGRALHECSYKYRLAFILYFIKGWDLLRIAKRLKLTKERSAQADAYRGRDFVKQYLKEHYREAA